MALVARWPQCNGSVTRALAEELVPKGLCLNPAGEYLACAFCRGRAGNPVEFATDAGLQNHYLRQSGASRNWHGFQAAYDQRAQQARASATGTGTAGAPNPKDESGTQAPPPTETSVPYERAKAPEPEPSRQRTIAELCSFVGDSPYTGKVVNSEKGRLTIATTTKTRNQAGQVLREEEQILPRATLWVGGLHAFLQHAIYVCRSASGRSPRPTSSSSRWPSRRSTTQLRREPHNSTRCVIHYATGNSEEEGATLKLTHGETAFQKFRAVTGLEPSRVLAPAGRGPADRGYPRQNQREAEDDNRWYWHEDRRAAPKRPWQPWQPDRWHQWCFFSKLHDPERTPSWLSRGGAAFRWGLLLRDKARFLFTNFHLTLRSVRTYCNFFPAGTPIACFQKEIQKAEPERSAALVRHTVSHPAPATLPVWPCQCDS